MRFPLKNWTTLAAGVLLLTTPIWVRWHFFMPYRPNGLAIILIPIMALALATTIRFFERDRPSLQRLLLASLMLKFVAIAAYTWTTFGYYGYADNGMYFDTAQTAQTIDQVVPLQSNLTGTHFMLRATWVVVQFLGNSFTAVAFFFGCVAFVGQWLFVRVAILFRNFLDLRLVVPLLLFMPSILFWSASIGKEAVIYLGLGLFCLGFAKVVQGGMSVLPIIYGGVGLFLTMLVRPHIAAMVAIAAFSGFTMASTRRVKLGVMGRLAGWVLLAASIAYLIPRAQSFLQLDELSIESTTNYLTMRIGQTDIGGSAFGVATLVERVLLGPLLLFRPMPWEISSPTAAISSAEGLFLLWLVWTRRSQLIHTARNLLKHPYVLFQALFILEFVVAFSSISNWGIIARQRIMILPMVFWLLGLRSQKVFAKSPGGVKRQRVGPDSPRVASHT